MNTLRVGMLPLATVINSGMIAQKPFMDYILSSISKRSICSSGICVANAFDAKKFLMTSAQMRIVPLTTGFRNYVTKKSEPLPTTPPSTPSNLLQREQVEKVFFRIVAFVWDFFYFLIVWLRKMAKDHIIEDPTVRFYWKRFHEKMAESKKGD